MPVCANNKVSRGGLHTPPTPSATPVFERVPQISASDARARVEEARNRIEDASKAVARATTIDLGELLRAARAALDTARRTPGARGELRSLEQKVEQLERDIRQREDHLAQEHHEHGLRQQQASQHLIDVLAPRNLGLGPTTRVASAPEPLPSEQPMPQTSEADVRAARAAKVEARRVADRARSATLEELVEAKKAAQKALARARSAEVPAVEINGLLDAVKAVQRAESKLRSQDAAQKAEAQPKVVHVESGSKGEWSEILRNPPASSTVIVDERMVYETDERGRTVRAQTVLAQVVAKEFRGKEFSKLMRHDGDQRMAGGEDRLPDDHGGHIFGRLFGGPGEAINMSAMDRSINQSAFATLEKLWEEQVDRHDGIVNVTVDFTFVGESKRAESFSVTFDLNGGESVSVPFYQ